MTRAHWRVGHTSGRVVYRGDERVGYMADAHVAMQIVEAMNTSPTILDELRKINHSLENLMAGQADIDASVAAVGAMVADLRDTVVPGITNAQAKLDTVIADLRNQGVDTTALAEVTAALTDARTGLDSTVAALVADPNIPTDTV